MSLLLEGVLTADDDLNDDSIPAIVGLYCNLADTSNRVLTLPSRSCVPCVAGTSVVACDPAVGDVTAIVGLGCWFPCFYADVILLSPCETL